MRTTTGCVVTGLLAEESLVLDCVGRSVSLDFDLRTSISLCSLRFRIRCSTLQLVPRWATFFHRVVGERTLGAEELSRNVEGLAADDDNLLAVQELLGDSAGQTTEQVSLAINDDL